MKNTKYCAKDVGCTLGLCHGSKRVPSTVLSALGSLPSSQLLLSCLCNELNWRVRSPEHLPPPQTSFPFQSPAGLCWVHPAGRGGQGTGAELEAGRYSEWKKELLKLLLLHTNSYLNHQLRPQTSQEMCLVSHLCWWRDPARQRSAGWESPAELGSALSLADVRAQSRRQKSCA